MLQNQRSLLSEWAFTGDDLQCVWGGRGGGGMKMSSSLMHFSFIIVWHLCEKNVLQAHDKNEIAPRICFHSAYWLEAFEVN